MTSAVNEKTITRRLRRACMAREVLLVRLIPSHAGMPDYMIIKGGKLVFVETKRPGGEARPVQIAYIELLKKYGMKTFIVDSDEKITEAIDAIA